MRRFILTLLAVLFISPANAEVGSNYSCEEVNFIVGNNHNFTRQNVERFILNQHQTKIFINGGFLNGSNYDYHSSGPNKFFGGGMNYAFTFDNGYFQFTQVSKFINELYVITANCRRK